MAMTLARAGAVFALLALFLGSPAAVVAETAAPRITVAVDVPTHPDIPYRLAATLVGEDGRPIAGAPVTLYAVVDLLGERTAVLGAGTTDVAGTARVPVVPRKAEYVVVAQFRGDGEHARAEVRQAVTFPAEAVVPFAPGHPTGNLLAPVRSLMPLAIGLAVAALWAGLAGLALWTVLSLRRVGGGQVPAPTKETVL
jgi:hypothetical protein